MSMIPGLPMIPGVSLTAPTDVPVQQARPVRVAKPADRYGWWWGTGRRKSAVARIRMKPGTPGMTITTKTGGTKTVEQYFSEDRDRAEALIALKTTDTLDRFQIIVKMHGGGYMGQAAALKLAVARALIDYDPSFYDALRAAGMLTRDPREVERKKYGQAGARRRFQFSKR